VFSTVNVSDVREHIEEAGESTAVKDYTLCLILYQILSPDVVQHMLCLRGVNVLYISIL
jgi:hypothetical protein